MARPVRPGTGTTHRMSEASQPGKQNGTLFADPIMASSPKSTASTGRTEDCSRPTPIHQISLAMREPSTEDVRRAQRTVACCEGEPSYTEIQCPYVTGRRGDHICVICPRLRRHGGNSQARGRSLVCLM